MNPKLTNMANLARELARVIPHLYLQSTGIMGRQPYTPRITPVPGSVPHTYMAIFLVLKILIQN